MSELQPPMHEELILRRRRMVRVGTALLIVICVAGAVAAYLYVARERAFAARTAAAMKVVSTDEGDIEAAIADLKLAIQRRPDDVDAVASLARAMMRRTPASREHVIEAVRYYNRAVELQPDRLDDRIELVRLLDHLGASDALLKVIDPLIDARPQEPRYHELRTRHLMALNKPKEAEAAAKAWTAAAPNDCQAQLNYIGLLMGNGKDQRESRSHLNTALPKIANQDVAAAVRAAWLLGTNERNEAARLIDVLLAQPKRDPQINRMLVTALDQLGRVGDADKLTSAALSDQNDDSLLSTSVQRDIDRANYTRAFTTIQQATPSMDMDRRAYHLALKAFLASRNGRREVADQAVKELESLPIEVSGVWRAVLRAATLGPGDKDAARELLPQLRVSVLLQEDVALLRVATANCLVLLDQSRAADRILAEAMGLPVGWSISAKRLVDLRRSRGEFVQAVEAAQFAFNRSGKTIDSAVMLAQAVAASRPTGAQADNLLQLLRQIQTSIPGEVQTLGLYIDMLAQRNDPLAKTVLKDALARGTPVPVDYLLQWADLSQKYRLGEEEACLARAVETGGMTPRIALSRAMFLHRSGKSGEALAQLQESRDAQSGDRRGYEEAIATFLWQTRSPDAAEAWNALAAAHPSDVALQQRVLGLGLGGTRDNQRAIIERIRKVEPGNVTAELADIRLLLEESTDRQTMDDAMMRLTRIVERLPDLTAARLLLIDLLTRTQNTRAALAQWEKAYSLDSDEPMLILTGTQLLIAGGERTRAAETLRKVDHLDANLTDAQRQDAARLYLALGAAPRTIELLGRLDVLNDRGRLMLAEAKFRTGDAAGCRAIIEDLLKQPSLDVLLFAAAIEDAQGNREASEKLLLQARDLNDLTDADRLRVAEFARERGEMDQVIGILATANASAELTLRIARLWLEQGEVDAAMKSLNEAASRLADAAPLRRRLKEEPQIRRLVDLKMFAVAADLLDQPDDIATQQLVQFALGTQSQTVREQQLALDRLAAQDQKSYTLAMFLADRFLAMNQPMNTEKFARAAADLRPSSPQPMAFAAYAASRAGNTGRCAEAIRDWRDRLSADDTRPDGIEARNLARRNEYTELLARFEAKARGNTSSEVLFSVAEAMHARSRDADALALLKPLIEKDSRFAIAWLRHVPENLSPTAAARSIDMVREIVDRRQLPSERVALAIAAERVARKAQSPQQLERAGAGLAEVEATVNELPIESVVQLAENRIERNELAIARTIYEKALSSRSDTAVLLTNLAEVLRRDAKLTDALAAIDQAITVNAALPAAHDTRAAILQELKQFDDALASAQTASRLDPLNPKWMLRVAVIQQAKGDFLAARSAMDTLRWFFREQEAWSPELIGRFHVLDNNLNRRPPTSKPAN